MTHRQIHPFDKRRVQPSREASPLQDDLEIAWCPEAHHVRDPNQPAPLIAFFHLAIDQARRHLPLLHLPSSTTHLEPLTEVSRQRIEVEVEPITGGYSYWRWWIIRTTSANPLWTGFFVSGQSGRTSHPGVKPPPTSSAGIFTNFFAT